MSNDFDFNSVWSSLFQPEEIQDRLAHNLVDIATLTKMMYDELIKVGFDKGQATSMTVAWIEGVNIAAARMST